MKIYEIDRKSAEWYLKLHIDAYDDKLSPILNLENFAKRTGDIEFVLDILFRLKENKFISNASYLANKNYFKSL